jgi:hypothetical protein
MSLAGVTDGESARRLHDAPINQAAKLLEIHFAVPCRCGDVKKYPMFDYN